MTDAETIVRELALLEPIVRMEDDVHGSVLVCGLCDAESEDTATPNNHTARCLWAKAKVWDEAHPTETP